MLKIAVFIFLLLASVTFAAPSIISYEFVIDGNRTNASSVSISPLSTPGYRDGLRINITANETVDWTVKIINSTGQKVAPGTSWTETNSTNILRPASCVWKGTSNQCDGDNLTDGNYTVNVTMSFFINSTDNRTITDLSRTIIIDNTPPSIFVDSAKKFTSNNTFSVNFTASDPSGISECTTEWTNEAGAAVNISGCQNQTLSGNEGNHTIRLWVNDTLSNTGVKIIEFIIDTTPPSVSIMSPENTTYNSSIINLSYSVNDTNIDTCTAELDSINNTLQNCTNSTLSVAIGSHVLRLWVNDSAGNINYSNVSFTANYTLPEIIIESPANTIHATQNISLSYRVAFGLCFYSLNNAGNVSLPNCTNTSLLLPDGFYFLQLFANDSGNINKSNVSFTVDTTPPSLTVNSPVNTTYSSTSVSISFVTSAVSCSYELNGASGNLPGCSNTTITATNGFNKITIFAKDSVGNTNSKSVNFTVTIPSSGSSSPPPSSSQTPQNTTRPPPRNQTNQTQQNQTQENQTQQQETNQTQVETNITANQTANATLPSSGFAFASPIPLGLAAFVVVLVAVAIAAWKIAARLSRRKSGEGVVIIR